jgi:hypothetical protein
MTSSGYGLSLTARKCRLVKTPATQMGMTNQWLKDQGLLSVKELWVNTHYRYSAVAHGNRLVRIRMPGGVGRGREILPLTLLERTHHFFFGVGAGGGAEGFTFWVGGGFVFPF